MNIMVVIENNIFYFYIIYENPQYIDREINDIEIVY